MPGLVLLALAAPSLVGAVSRPGNEATRRELEGYLRLWHVMHPEAPAFLTSP